MRCFVALELPAEVKAAAAEAVGVLRRTGADVKWVKPEIIHVTLKFLGEVDEGLAPDLGRALARACAGARPLELAVQGCGAFPSPQRPQVVWLGLIGQVEALAGLAAAVEREMAPLGFPPEGRAFKAHVTLGRARRGKGGRSTPPSQPLAQALAGMGGLAGPRFTANRVALMKSTLTPQGPIYDPVLVITLA